METPTDVSAKPKSKSIFKIIGKVLVIVLSLVGLLLIGMVVYFIINPMQTEQDILNKIRSEIVPSVVKVTCWSDDVTNATQSGAGLYYFDTQTGKPMVETNAHVVIGEDGEYHSCSVYFPDTDSSYDAEGAYLYHDVQKEIGTDLIKGIDYAQLVLVQSTSTSETLPVFPPKVPDAYKAIADMCTRSGHEQINVGDKVLLLGYPEIGGESLTLTDGVVSGFLGQQNEWLKVSAGANHGNSGGIAIGASDGCNYGMLSSATFASGYNLSFVLRSGLISDFVSATSSEPTFSPYVVSQTDDAQRYLTDEYNAGDFTIKYPSGWEVSTSTEDDNTFSLIEFYAQGESAIDSYREFLSIGVAHNTDVERYKKVVKSIKQLGSEIKFKGVQAYKYSRFVDNSRTSFDKNVTGTRLVFLKNGNLYSIIGYWQNDKKLNYDKIIDAMIDSIEFK